MAGSATASVEVLAAEVRVLMVGSRQVTLSVYRQLDTVPHGQCEPFGRVRDSKDASGRLWVVGRRTTDGTLVRSSRQAPRPPDAPTYAPLAGWYQSGRGPRYDHKMVTVNGCRWVAHIAANGEDQVNWYIRPPYEVGGCGHGDDSWSFSSPETAELAAQVAQDELADLRHTRRLHEEWSALPLIVLAGLR